MSKKKDNKVESMKGKVCMITGCNSGIGKEAARELAVLGARVIMVCRNQNSGMDALNEIRTITGNNKIELMVADLSSQKSIHRLVDNFNRKDKKLDVLINNAGILNKERTLTEDGIETQLAVNLLAPFMLSSLLLDCLKAAAPSRIINVTSKMHRYSGLDFDNLHGEKRYNKWVAYNQAKLGVLLFSYELSRMVEGSGVTVNCLHPGVAATGIMRQFPSSIRGLWDLFCISPEKGAENSIFLASSPDVEGRNGLYFERMKEKKSSRKSYDRLLAQGLLHKCSQLTGIKI